MKKIYSPMLLRSAALMVALLISSAFAAFSNGENYKDWDYTPTSVFGLMKLETTTNRSFYKITRMNAQSTKVQEYNAAGIVINTTVVRFFNGNLKLVTETDQWGQTYQTTKFTLIGNGIFSATETNTGKNSLLPCKSVKYIYKNNLLAEKRYLSYSGKLCNNSSGFAIVKYKRYADKNRFSLIMEQSFYGPDGNPVMAGSYDSHRLVYQRDERGNDITVAYFGINGEPLTNRYGGFKYRYGYDQNDNYITYENIGLNEEVTENAYGVAKYEYTYKNGFLATETRYNDKDKISRASAAGDGVAMIRNDHDENGNLVQISYYDENLQPVNNNSGYQRISYKFSPLNMLTSIEYFDKNQQPTSDVYGIHRYSYERDDKGRATQMAYYDKANNPVKNNTDQVYMLKYKYDELGRKSSESYWKDAATKMARWNGYHEYIIRYNQDGQEIEVLYFDENGNLGKTNDGYSRRLITYYPNADLSEISFFDGKTPIVTSGALVSNYHAIKYFYDNNNRRSSVEYFDGAGKPANASIAFTEKFSCHKIEFIYQGNRIIQENCYLADGDTPVKIIDCLKNNYISTMGISYGYKNQ